jgi:hypothetical protein
MVKIIILSLPSAGYDLFDDSESFMQDLSESELDLQGGLVPFLRLPVICTQGEDMPCITRAN